MAPVMAPAMANRMAEPMRFGWQKDAPNPNPNPNTSLALVFGLFDSISKTKVTVSKGRLGLVIQR